MQDVVLFDFIKEGDEEICGSHFAKWRQVAGPLAIGRLDIQLFPTGEAVALAVVKMFQQHLNAQPMRVSQLAYLNGSLSATALAFYEDGLGALHKLEAHVMWSAAKPVG